MASQTERQTELDDQAAKPLHGRIEILRPESFESEAAFEATVRLECENLIESMVAIWKRTRLER